MADMDWPHSLMPNFGRGRDPVIELAKARRIIDELLREIPTGLKPQEIRFLADIVYDDYLGSLQEKSTPENRMIKPLMSSQILEAERYSLRSKEREMMNLFASSRVAERIPGMTWEKFLTLTPYQTDMVFDITRLMGQATDSIHDGLNKSMEELKREAQKLNKGT